jgi:hypothetical protein
MVSKLSNINKILIENEYAEELLNNNHKCITDMRSSFKGMSTNLNDLHNEFGKLQSDLKQVSERLSNISKLTSNILQIQKSSPEFYSKTETNYFTKMTDFTKKWSESYVLQVDYIKENFQEFYGNFKLEYDGFDELINDYFNSKNSYTDFKVDLSKKKEKYYKQQNFDKWDMTNTDVLNKQNFLANKDECLKKMLVTETKELKQSELKYYFFSKQVLQQYSKLRKYLNSLLSNQNNNMALENRILLGDICYVMKLVTMNI